MQVAFFVDDIFFHEIKTGLRATGHSLLQCDTILTLKILSPHIRGFINTTGTYEHLIDETLFRMHTHHSSQRLAKGFRASCRREFFLFIASLLLTCSLALSCARSAHSCTRRSRPSSSRVPLLQPTGRLSVRPFVPRPHFAASPLATTLRAWAPSSRWLRIAPPALPQAAPTQCA